MEIISVGKRLKKLRKELNIKQEEITGNQISRNLISIIENDKANLTPKVAIVISHQINEICKIRGLEYRIEPEELLESEESYAIKETLKLIREIESGKYNFHSLDKQRQIIQLDTLLRTFKQFKLSYQLLTLCAAVLNATNIEFSYLYTKRANELVENIDDNSLRLQNMINVSYYAILQEKHEEAIYYCNAILNRFKTIDAVDEFKVLMNLNIASSKIGDDLQAERAIDRMLLLKGLSKDDYYKILISKANRYFITGKISESKSIYLEILDSVNYEQKYLVLGNLLDIYREEDNPQIDEVIINAQAHLMKDLKKDSIYICKFYLKLALAYKHIEKFEMFVDLILLAFAVNEENRPLSELKLVILESIQYLKDHENSRVEDELYAQVCSLVKNRQIRAGDKVIWCLLEYFVSNSKLDTVKNLIYLINISFNAETDCYN